MSVICYEENLTVFFLSYDDSIVASILVFEIPHQGATPLEIRVDLLHARLSMVAFYFVPLLSFFTECPVERFVLRALWWFTFTLLNEMSYSGVVRSILSSPSQSVKDGNRSATVSITLFNILYGHVRIL